MGLALVRYYEKGLSEASQNFEGGRPSSAFLLIASAALAILFLVLWITWPIHFLTLIIVALSVTLISLGGTQVAAVAFSKVTLAQSMTVAGTNPRCHMTNLVILLLLRNMLT